MENEKTGIEVKLQKVHEEIIKLGEEIKTLKSQFKKIENQEITENSLFDINILIDHYFTNSFNNNICYLGLNKNNDYFLISSTGEIKTGTTAFTFIKQFVTTRACIEDQEKLKNSFLWQLNNSIQEIIDIQKDNIARNIYEIKAIKETIRVHENEIKSAEDGIDFYKNFHKTLKNMCEDNKFDPEKIKNLLNNEKSFINC